MATTRHARELTDAHRIAQVENAARWCAILQALLGEIDPARIDVTAPIFAQMGTLIADEAMKDSARLAAAYLPAYRAAEVGAVEAATLPLVVPKWDLTPPVARLEVLAPMAKARIAKGAAAREAIDETFQALTGGFTRDFLTPGRNVVVESAGAKKHGRWRRVTDAQPCAWCAMLAGRGPVYHSAERAGGLGHKFHAHCGCTVEEQFGDWEPTRREQQFADLYKKAHRPGDTAADTTRRMRKQGDGIVNDATGSSSRPDKRPLKQRESMVDAVTKVNPRYETDPAYRRNCSNVVVAVEHRVRGLDVVAKPQTKGRTDDVIRNEWRLPDKRSRQWVTHEATRSGPSFRESVDAFGADLPVGARGFMILDWRDGPSRHIINWERGDEKIVLRDGQVSRTDVESYLSQATKIRLLRVDDLEFVGDLDDTTSSRGGE